jgi:urease accessory protein
MTKTPIAQIRHAAGSWTGKAETCALDYAQRFIRRKKLVTDQGTAFLVDLAQTTSLDHGDALVLDSGAYVQIIAAPEALFKVTGPDLVRAAWHVGNRHTPCQIMQDHLLIQADPVIAHMLDHVGARCDTVTAPFTPEGGAYGHGRTHAHEHGHSAHDHAHHHAHAHSHDH